MGATSVSRSITCVRLARDGAELQLNIALDSEAGEGVFAANYVALR